MPLSKTNLVPAYGRREFTRPSAGSWLVASLSGTIGGALIGMSGYEIIVVAPIFGLIVGCISSLGANSHKFLFGLLGSALCVLTALFGAIVIWGSKFMGDWSFAPAIVSLGTLIGAPAIIGSALAPYAWRIYLG